MKLASYKSTRSGWRGLANILIRWRLKGVYSHSEIVFDPDDRVDDLMPDGSCEPADGALWCASSVAAEKLPPWSRRRAGRTGGVRFKRIDLSDGQWDLLPLPGNACTAARRALEAEGAPYDWQAIAGYLAWFIPDKASRYACGEFVAHCIGLRDPERFDPCVLHAAVGGGQS